MNIELGDRVKDKITGFTGIVVCVSKWLNGCVRLVVQPEKLDKGRVGMSETFDEEQLDMVHKKVIVTNKTAEAERPAKAPGGPRPHPERGQMLHR